MSEQEQQAAEQTTETQAAEPHGTDWKAESRKWERYAKENSAQVNELTAANEARMADLQRATDELASATARIAELEAAQARRELVARVASATGVPSELVETLGSADEAELTKAAQAWAGHYSQGQRALPHVPTDTTSAHAPSQTSGQLFREFMEQNFNV